MAKQVKPVIDTPDCARLVFPPNVLRALKNLESVPVNPNQPIDDISYGVAKEWGRHEQQYIIGDYKDRYDIVYSFYKGIKLQEWITHTRRALESGGIECLKQTKTLIAYRCDQRHWFLLEDCALSIQRIPRGGFGIICTPTDYMHDYIKISGELSSMHQIRMQLIASAKAKLTPDELKALNLA